MYGNSILIPYDLIVDTDLGLINLVKEEYNNPKFVTGMIDIPENIMINEILECESTNVLSIIFKKEYKDNIDGFKTQFIDTKYNRILELSKPTALMTMIEMYIKTNLISINILCKNQLEEQDIKRYKNISSSKVNIIVQDDLSKINIENYDSIFVKMYSDILKYSNVQGKSIFMGNYKYNLENNKIGEIIPLIDVTLKVGDTNKIFLIDVHTIDESNNIQG